MLIGFVLTQVNLLLGEPVFQCSVVPWHNLYFAHWKSKVEHLLDNKAVVLPGKAHVFAIPIQMRDLWKIRAPVGSTQNLDLRHFDELIAVLFDLRCLSLKLITLNLSSSFTYKERH